MKKFVKKRVLSLLLTVMLLFGLLPASAMAEGTGTFVLVAEANGKLAIEPEYITYTDGQTVREALLNSGHTFTGMENDWITEIDGVVGNYVRSDEDGDYSLNKAASDVSFYRFCEEEEGVISAGLQKLMTAMADYNQKPGDVKKAAQAAYQTAKEQFVGIDSQSALVLADGINQAINAYESVQNGPKYSVTFKDGSNICTDATITVSNDYGKVWTDDGDGLLSLPKDDYDFCINKDGLWAEGQMSVTTNQTITVTLPEQLWLNQDTFRLSGSYGAEDNEDNKFTDDEYTLGEWSGRNITVAVPDTFTGRIYSYAEYDKTLLTVLPTLKAVYTSAATGEETEQVIPFESLTSGASSVLKKGAEGNTVIYRISSQGQDGYVYSQDYTVKLERTPSLSGISVVDQKGIGQTATTAFDSNETDYVYKVLDTITEVTVKATPLEEEYSVLIDGQDATEGVTIPLASGTDTKIAITVSANGCSNTYNLTIQPGEGKALSFVTENTGVTLEVVNRNGEVLAYEKFREGTNANRYQYTLVPGETYSYVATSGTYYHIADEFTMEDVADSTIRVSVPTDNWLSGLAFGTGSALRYKGTLSLDKSFNTSNHRYAVQYVDTEHLAYVWVDTDSELTVQAIYDQKFASALYHNKETSIDLIAGANTGTQLKRFLMDENPLENTVTIRLTKEADGITYFQDYLVDFKRILTLEDISVKNAGMQVSLIKEDGKAGYVSDVFEYSVTVSMAAEAIDLSFVPYTDKTCYGEEKVGYRIKVDGVDVTDTCTATIPLDGTMNTQNVVITVENDKSPTGTSEYILHILKSPPVEATFELSLGTGLLTIYESVSGERLWPDENGKYQFCEGYTYNYAFTAFGYVSKAGTLSVTRNLLKALVVVDGDETYRVTETAEGGGALTISWSLEKAAVNSAIRADMTAEWPNFRGNDANNGVTDAAIPTKAEDGTLYWANKIGKGYSSEAVGSPIIVDGDLITYARAKIYRVDTVTGEIKVTGDMDHKSAHATTPPSYADGMVFVALTDGTVQAFNTDTLESLWIYKDPLGGQPICPLTIKDGYLYTGFWNSETADANFVCLSITDEDPAKADESKCVSWYYTSKGGYYWAGAYASEDYVIVGTDDGTSVGNSQTSRLLLLDAKTGELLDCLENLNGDVRSTVVHDSATDAYYFTSKGGTFYSVQVKADGDGWAFANKWNVALENGANNYPMSTSSPAVYNGRAYVGVSGAAQFGAYSGHNITVIDLSKKALAYSVKTQGYPQTSGLLTTAYEETSGYVYIYFFDNMTPGKLRVLRDKAGQTAADYITTEGKYQTAYALFTPTNDQAQYAICSPIVDEYGTVYFKNDSAHLMAFGSAIQKIEVTTQPDKMTYEEGETFDPTGMVVTATYANGKTRDITEYITYNEDILTAENSLITIAFPYVMYHNEEDGTAMTSGVTTTTPITTLQLTVGYIPPVQEEVAGDVTGDGKVDQADARAIIDYYYENISFTEEQIAIADVNLDGRIDTVDANMLVAYYCGKISQLPTKNQ